jgi:basic amino acid/polyamine antiporter, APA family
VAAGVLLLRRTDPDRERPFRTPFVPVVPIVAIGLAAWLVTSLEPVTWLRFGGWMLLGLVVYAVYSRRRSVVGRREGTD